MKPENNTFNFRNFVRQGLIDAAGWHDKGVLLEEDLAEIQARLDAKNATGDVVDEATV